MVVKNLVDDAVGTSRMLLPDMWSLQHSFGVSLHIDLSDLDLIPLDSQSSVPATSNDSGDN